jgi:hypothetical protein
MYLFFLSVETKQFGLYRYISASLVSPSWGDCQGNIN